MNLVLFYKNVVIIYLIIKLICIYYLVFYNIYKLLRKAFIDICIYFHDYFLLNFMKNNKQMKLGIF
jgi:hypothetical protein